MCDILSNHSLIKESPYILYKYIPDTTLNLMGKYIFRVVLQHKEIRFESKRDGMIIAIPYTH